MKDELFSKATKLHGEISTLREAIGFWSAWIPGSYSGVTISEDTIKKVKAMIVDELKERFKARQAEFEQL
jgi:hypothetical protein